MRTWNGDEGVEIVARPRGGDGEVCWWWKCGCEGVMKEGRCHNYIKRISTTVVSSSMHC